MMCVLCVRWIRSEVENLALRLGIKLYRICVKDDILVKDGMLL